MFKKIPKIDLLEDLFGVDVQTLGEVALILDNSRLNDIYVRARDAGKDNVLLTRDERRIYDSAKKSYRSVA